MGHPPTDDVRPRLLRRPEPNAVGEEAVRGIPLFHHPVLPWSSGINGFVRFGICHFRVRARNTLLDSSVSLIYDDRQKTIEQFFKRHFGFHINVAMRNTLLFSPFFWAAGGLFPQLPNLA